MYGLSTSQFWYVAFFVLVSFVILIHLPVSMGKIVIAQFVIFVYAYLCMIRAQVCSLYCFPRTVFLCNFTLSGGAMVNYLLYRFMPILIGRIHGNLVYYISQERITPVIDRHLSGFELTFVINKLMNFVKLLWRPSALTSVSCTLVPTLLLDTSRNDLTRLFSRLIWFLVSISLQ